MARDYQIYNIFIAYFYLRKEVAAVCKKRTNVLVTFDCNIFVKDVFQQKAFAYVLQNTDRF